MANASFTLLADGLTMLAPENIGTYAGQSAAVLVVTNGIRSATGFSPKWMGLVISILISILTAYFSQTPESPQRYFLAIVNAFLIYSTAIGGNQLGAAGSVAIGRAPKKRRGVGITGGEGAEVRFFAPWFGGVKSR